MVCFVRHGETDWNVEGRLQGQEDIPLNSRGREQARQAGLALRDQRWDAVVASPLTRAWETAQIIAAQLGGADVRPDPRLVERDYGDAAGMINAEVRTAFPDDRIPHMESLDALRERGMAALTDILADNPGKRVLVVAHGGVINAILSVLSGGAIGSGKTRLENACLSVVEHRAGQWAILSHNALDHLVIETG